MDGALGRGMLVLVYANEQSDITTIESSKIGEFTLVNIISYDLIAKEDVCRQIEEEQFKIVIVDESHFIKSTNAKVRRHHLCINNIAISVGMLHHREHRKGNFAFRNSNTQQTI
jgi:hypothetical protein